MFRLSRPDNANQDASDSNNGKLNNHYADLIETEKFLLQNLFKNTKIEPGEKKGKKEYFSKNRNRTTPANYIVTYSSVIHCYFNYLNV